MLLGRRQGNDGPNDLVPRDTRKLHAKRSVVDNLVAEYRTSAKMLERHCCYVPSADTACEHFDNDLAVLGILPSDFNFLEASALLHEGVGGV